jgi:histone H4
MTSTVSDPGNGANDHGRRAPPSIIKNKRHRKVLRDTVAGITCSDIRRLARRGGVKRLNGFVYENTRGVLRLFLENLIKDTVIYTEGAERKTVTAFDVVRAMKRQGRTTALVVKTITILLYHKYLAVNENG